ncbi:MAG: sialate O-acetylesterase [Phycisphaerales bacterium JB040]
MPTTPACPPTLAISLAALATHAGACLAAPPELPSWFSDHAVLQRDADCTIWGIADPRANITVELAGHDAVTAADADGRWSVTLPPSPAGGPHTLTVTASGTHGDAVPEFTSRADILFGDVWLAGGQSNMEWPLHATTHGEEFIAGADDDRLRLITLPHQTAAEPQTQAESSGWSPTTPETARTFSAVAYHFGAVLREHEGVPIGLISTNWGGTRCEAWTPQPVVQAGGYEGILKRDQEQGAADHRSSGSLYNAMIHPLTPLKVSGAIWYQGESNAGRAEQYRTLFPAMIESWRDAFGQPDMPFYFVQLANFKERADEPQESEWAELREAQAMAASSVPHTGMACIIDVGEADDIHPRNKHDVGRRLARLALRDVYGASIVAEGPTFNGRVTTRHWQDLDPEIPRMKGMHAIGVEFDHAGDLHTADGEPPLAFEIATADGPFVRAEAEIDGDTVWVWADGVEAPAHVRYAWADNPAVNLVNGDGLPAVPFRTDDRAGLTAGRE